eukprot:5003005-Pleurochrysis_carterae.AAC.1
MDNKSALDLAYNPEHHQRSKHIHRTQVLDESATRGRSGRCHDESRWRARPPDVRVRRVCVTVRIEAE